MTWQGRTTGQGSTWAWRKARTKVLRRDQHRCQLRYDGCIGYAGEVDHIDGVAITNIPRAQMTNIDRLRAACGPCHGKRTQAQASSARLPMRRPAERHPGLI